MSAVHSDGTISQSGFQVNGFFKVFTACAVSGFASCLLLMKKDIKNYFKRIGSKGGKSTSEAKVAAVRRNLKCARATRKLSQEAAK